MKKLFMALLVSYAFNANAQLDLSKNFVYLYSDSVIYAGSIKLRPDNFGSWQLRVDSRKFPTDQVKFFNNQNGFFANTRRTRAMGATTFSERIIEGRINLFQESRYDPFIDDPGYGYGYGYGNVRPQNVDIRMYYNKGMGDLQKVNYYNLSRDMADRPESMDLLRGYRKSMNTGNIMYAAAGASLVAGLVSFLVKGSDRQNRNHEFGTGFKRTNFTTSFLLLGVGAGLAGGGALIQMSGSRKLEDAVQVYNRP
jgi:hypothetical protein